MNPKAESKEILTLKELIQISSDWIKYFKTKWLILFIAIVIGAILGFFIAYNDRPVYTAELTFALEEKGGGNMYAGIASQLGFDLGSDGGAFSGDNSIELLKSRFLIEKSLLTLVNIDGKPQLLINRYREFSEMGKDWNEQPYLQAVQFVNDELRENFSLRKDSLLKQVYKSILKDNLDVRKPDKKLNIITVKFKIEDEIFAKYFTEALVKNVSDFYIETKTQKSKKNVWLLEQRVDSVRSVLNTDIYGVAVLKDQNMNTLRAQAGVQSVKKQMNIQVLTVMYGELVKNLELSKFSLMREEPLFQIIDKPILPLDEIRIRPLSGIISGGAIAAIITLIYLLIARIKSGTLD